MENDSGRAAWNGPYLRREVPLDPWGNEYVYDSDGRGLRWSRTGPTASAAVRAMKRILVSSRPPRHCRPASERGFTLLEILLVLSLIALASVLVAPNVGSLDARTYSVQLRQVNALLHYARRNAVITGLPVSARLYGPSFRSDGADIASADEFAQRKERGHGLTAGRVQKPKARWESKVLP